MAKLDTTDSVMKRRLQWRCNRGMLELDVILLNFFKHHFQDLSSSDQKLFERLLDSDDQLLFSWLFTQQQPDDAEVQRMIGIVRNS